MVLSSTSELPGIVLGATDDSADATTAESRVFNLRNQEHSGKIRDALSDVASEVQKYRRTHPEFSQIGNRLLE